MERTGAACCAELDVDVRWAGEPDVLLKLEPSTKWITHAIKIGPPQPKPLYTFNSLFLR